MTGIIRKYSDFSENLIKKFEELFDNFYSEVGLDYGSSFMKSRRFSEVSVIVNDNSANIVIYIPGLVKEDIESLELIEKRRGEYKLVLNLKEESLKRLNKYSYVSSKLEYNINLPRGITVDKVESDIIGGVLEIKIDFSSPKNKSWEIKIG